MKLTPAAKPSVSQRTKWKLEGRNLKINDMVLVKEENTPPLKWAIGRITEVTTGEDGHVRVVNVKTANGQKKRAITRICKLPEGNIH